MAKPKTADPKPAEPEFRAYAIVPVRGGLWVSRTLLVQGDQVQAYEDTEPDTRNACLGRVLGAMRSEG